MSITKIVKGVVVRTIILSCATLLASCAVMAEEAENTSEAVQQGGTAISAMRSSAQAMKVTFDYFLRSGYVANDLSDIPAVGEVRGSDRSEEAEFSSPQKVIIEMFEGKTALKPGDRLVVFDDMGSIREPNSGFAKRLIKNQAVVKVLEVQNGRCVAQVVRSFEAFKVGARVKLYDREVAFWKKAMERKEQPSSKIECYVVQGEPSRAHWNQADFIILTAGRKQGVVEGVIFELREKKAMGTLEEDTSVNTLCGMAKVFFAGPDYSVAVIVSNSHPIVRGFQAVYRP